jgi:hypothetical protein
LARACQHFPHPWRVAKQFGISTLFYGECPQNAYGGPLDEIDALEMTERWIATHGGHLGLRPSDMVGKLGITAADMRDYELIDITGMKAFFLGQFYPWDSHRNARVAVEAGMIAELPADNVWWSAENLDNAQTGIHDGFGWLKFGYGRCCAQISVDIRCGMISRDEAITVLCTRDGGIPSRYAGVELTEVLSHIGLTMKDFVRIANEHANPEIFNINPEMPPLMKRAVWERSFGS